MTGWITDIVFWFSMTDKDEISKRIFSFIDIIYTNTNLFVFIFLGIMWYVSSCWYHSTDTIFFLHCILMYIQFVCLFVTLALALVISKSNQSLNFNSIAPQPESIKMGLGILRVFYGSLYGVIWGISMGWQVLFYVLFNCLFLNEGRDFFMIYMLANRIMSFH